jgi:hypothetical protein
MKLFPIAICLFLSFPAFSSPTYSDAALTPASESRTWHCEAAGTTSGGPGGPSYIVSVRR